MSKKRNQMKSKYQKKKNREIKKSLAVQAEHPEWKRKSIQKNYTLVRFITMRFML